MNGPGFFTELEKKFSHFPQSSRVASWLNERYYFLADDLGVLFRQQKMTPGKYHTDCIPNFWLFGFNEFRGEISYLRDDKEIRLWGPQSFFIPPYSIVNWKFESESLDWYAFEGTSVLPVTLPSEPVYFSSDPLVGENTTELFRTLLASKNEWKPFGASNPESVLAKKVRRFINENFQQDLSVGLISQHLGVSIDVMTRHFKRAYRVTPSNYLRDLRLYQAALRITVTKEPLGQIAEEVGVQNYENFSKSFRNVFKTAPKNFREKSY